MLVLVSMLSELGNTRQMAARHGMHTEVLAVTVLAFRRVGDTEADCSPRHGALEGPEA
jgi:hypothetical protein